MNKYIKLFSISLGFLIFISNENICQSINIETAKLIKIADGFQFVEGPLWYNDALIFSDIPANKVYKWNTDSISKVFIDPSGNSNGLALDHDGRLLLAQHGERRVARINSNGSQTVLAEKYNNKKLNSPNDIAVKSDGSIFFTDPPYGISKDQEELGFSGIYRISPNGSLQLLDSTLIKPNGIAFSPDEKKLYVDDCELKIIYEWDVIGDTAIGNKKQFAVLNEEGSGADGMKVDAEGRLFSTGPGGIWIFSSEGNLLKKIHVPGQTTNCNWGGKNGNQLFITSGDAIYFLSDK